MKAIAQAALTGMTRRLPARIPGTGAIGVAAALLCAGIVSLTLLRCESRYEYFIVEVDRLEVPDSLSCNDTLQVRLFGTIGVNSSYELDLIDARSRRHGIDLTVWGRRDREAHTVLDVLVPLRERYDVHPVAPGVFRIRVRQPDGSILSDSTIVH